MERRKTSVETKSLLSSAAGVLVIPPNPQRHAILIGNPHFIDSSNGSKSVHNASTAAAGVVLSFTVPAGQFATLTSATMFTTAGPVGAVANLQWTTGGVTTTLTTVTTAGVSTLAVPLGPGDTVQWNVTTTQVAGTADFTLGISLSAGTHGTTLVSVGAGRTPGQGIPVSNLINYLLLTERDIGDAVTASIILEDSAGAQQTYTWTEWVWAK